MITLAVLLVSALVILADRKLLEELKRKHHDRKYSVLKALLWADDLLLPTMMILGRILPDNTEPFCYALMWTNWIWLMTVAPRMVFFALRYLHHPRIGAVLALGVCVLFAWGATLGRTTIRLGEEEYRSTRLPAAFDGLRIVQLTDQHIGTLARPEAELKRIVDQVNALRPDLVICTGDLVTIRYTELNAARRAILGRIHAPMGVYAVLGNHDVGAYIKDTVALPRAENTRRLIALQEEMGWRVLDNESILLERGGERITLSGASFDVEQRKERHDRDLPAHHLDEVYRAIPDSLFNITAVHIPQWWDQILEKGFGDLTLAGHVHSMQCKINLFGMKISPARILYPRWSGRYDRDGKMLYISDGTGYVGYPVRLGAYPEVTLITLRKCE